MRCIDGFVLCLLTVSWFALPLHADGGRTSFPSGCGHGYGLPCADAAPLSSPQAPPTTPPRDREAGQERQYGANAIVRAGPLTVGAALGHASYSATVPREILLKVDLLAVANAPIRRKPLNLALVFDRSGSMAEEKKFDRAMQAAKLVVENLSAQDVVSLVVFNDEALVLSPAGKAVNKDFLFHRLTEIEPGGNTNLSAGLLEAFAQIDSQQAAGQHKQVIVLTDGLANRGVTSPQRLRQLVSLARGREIHLSTLGCGVDFDGALLQGLATAGSGRYTFVENAEQIPTAIAAELTGLLQVVAQNVKVEIRPLAGSRITRLYGRLIDGPLESHAMDVGDMRDEERGFSVVAIEPSARTSGGTLEVAVHLSFDDPETGKRTTRVLRVRAEFAADARRVRAGENKGVGLYAGVLEAMEQAEEAIEGLDTARFAALRKSFDRVYAATRRHAVDAHDQLLLNQAFLMKHYMEELWAASESALLHDHGEAKQRLHKDIEYRRYLLGHHHKKESDRRP